MKNQHSQLKSTCQEDYMVKTDVFLLKQVVIEFVFYLSIPDCLLVSIKRW